MEPKRTIISFDQQMAWVDEYGDSNLDTSISSVSECYIITAVVLSASETDAVRSQVDAIRKKHFQTGEMKSSTVGSNDKRREAILSDLVAIPFRFYSLVVDKKAVYEDGGLAHKTSFMKFINGLVYSALYGAYTNLDIIIDNHGSQEFMESFRDYVRVRHMPTLLQKSASFAHGNSRDEPLIQLADFLSGTLARLFDSKKKSSRPEQLISLLKRRAIAVEEWPRTFFGQGEEAAPGDGEHDLTIRSYALRAARNFIAKHVDVKDELVRRQVLTARHLLFHFTMHNNVGYVEVNDLKKVLDLARLPIEGRRFLQSQVIGPLRDSGVIIVSSPTGGYKLPRYYDEAYQYIRMSAGIIGPMLSRIRVARSGIKLATGGAVDLLGSPDHRYLSSLVDLLPTSPESAQLKLADD